MNKRSMYYTAFNFSFHKLCLILKDRFLIQFPQIFRKDSLCPQLTPNLFLESEEKTVFIKQIHTLTSNILFESNILLLKQYVAGERVDLLGDYDFLARTITEKTVLFSTRGKRTKKSEFHP